MAKLKRFYWVWSPRGTTRHMAATRIEGLTRCGRVVTIGWKWALGGSKALRERPRCKDCQRAA
jgi:hypothetical protein